MIIGGVLRWYINVFAASLRITAKDGIGWIEIANITFGILDITINEFIAWGDVGEVAL